MQVQAPDASAGSGSLIEDEVQTEIVSARDIVTARQQARARGIALGLTLADVTRLAAAISEIARNIVEHAGNGRILVRIVDTGERRGLQIIARDDGPGIPDVEQALQYGRSTRRRTGIGLPGVRWLVDKFDIVSEVGGGTTVTMTNWVSE